MGDNNNNYQVLLEYVRELHFLGMAKEVLEWDQETCMPPGGVEVRSKELSALSGALHEKASADELGRLIEAARSELEDEDQEANLREIERAYKRLKRVPKELVQAVSRLGALSQDAWIKARNAADFSIFAPRLAEMVSLKKEVAEHLKEDGSTLYDALLEDFEEGTTEERISTLFSSLRNDLAGLLARIVEKGVAVDESMFKGSFPRDRQEELCRSVAATMGFDFQTGRLDASAHPFTSGCLGDVRMTTRYDEEDFRPALYALIHETGHALYEQGTLPEHQGTPLGSTSSMGVHESQSRLWENQVGRGRPFSRFLYNRTSEIFGSRVAEGGHENFYKGVNVVKPSFIRVEADEVTYNLHILVRFELERRLISGDMGVDQIPAAWNDMYGELLGIRPSNDAEGCLQDVHWSWGLFGYFPTYTLGNLYSAQLYAKIQEDVPGLDQKLEKGDTRDLLAWLREKVHRNGRRYMPLELVERATGEKPGSKALVSYLEDKYSEIYGI